VALNDSAPATLVTGECVRTLGTYGLEKAHRIRKTGNDAMRGKEPSENEAWAVPLDVREILEQLLATSKAA
jgi:hypothetical protein